MKLCIISPNNFLKETLEQVQSMKQFEIHRYENELRDYAQYDLVIFVATQSKKYDIPAESATTYDLHHHILISQSAGADLQIPFKLTTLLSLIQDKLFKKHYYLKDITFIPSQRIMLHHENNITLTEKECNLLLYLITQYPREIHRLEILKDVWNYSASTNTTTVEVHLSRLRNKLQLYNLTDLIIYKNHTLSLNPFFLKDGLYSFRK